MDETKKETSSNKKKFLSIHLLTGRILAASIASTVLVGSAFSQDRIDLDSNEKQLNESTTKESYEALKDYPNDFFAKNTQKRLARDPFDLPMSELNNSMNTPNISVIGFAKSMENSSVFLKVGLDAEKAYKVGDEIVNGYRIIQIDMPEKQVDIGNGDEILSYKITDALK